MKILRIYTRLPPLKGGMEKHIYSLSLGQITLGHDVTIFFNAGEKVSKNDIQVCKFNLFNTKPRLLGIVIFYLLIVFKLIVKKEKYDVVHIHGDWSSLLFANIIKRLTASKVLAFSIHDDIKENFIYKRFFSILLNRVDIIFSTGFLAAKKIENFTNKKVIVQPSGINNMFFEPFTKRFSKKVIQVITVANLVPKKNLDLILDIAKKLKNIKFIIVGEGKERKKLQRRIDLELIDNLTLFGFKTPKEIKKLYIKSDLFLLTSLKEGTPTSILEAMSCGLAIVSSNAGGIQNIINNGVNGFIVEGWIKERYINILLEFDANLLKDIYKNNIELSKKFRWTEVSLKITNKFNELQ